MTRSHRVTLMMSDAELQAISEWQHDNRVSTLSKAIRHLCETGMEKPHPSVASLGAMMADAKPLLPEEAQYFGSIACGEARAMHDQMQDRARELSDALSRATVSVEVAGRLFFGLSRNASYLAAKRGDMPTIKIGGKLLVPVAILARKLGLTPHREGSSNVSDHGYGAGTAYAS